MMKRILFVVVCAAPLLSHADIIYTLDLIKALRPLEQRIQALENGGASKSGVTEAQVTNIVTGVVDKKYVESLDVDFPVSQVTSNTVKQIVTPSYINELGYSLQPLSPVTNLTEVTEVDQVGDLVDAVNTLVKAVKELQVQWQEKQLQSNGDNP